MVKLASAAPAAKIPEGVDIAFPNGTCRSIQVNFCKNPRCPNFGVPAGLAKYARRSKAAHVPGADYKLVAAGAGQPLLHCLLCGEHLPLKSNQGISEEVERLSLFLWTKPERSCPNAECANQRVGVSAGKSHYYSKGKTEQGSQRYVCRLCGKSFSIPAVSTQRQRIPHKNKILLKLLLGKMPLSRICDVLDIAPKTLYDRIEFFYQQSLRFAAHYEQRLFEKPPQKRLYLAVDRQVYCVNWSKRKDKRNVMLHAIGTADLTSSYVFGMHLNFDSKLDNEAIEQAAKACDDYSCAYPFRRYARHWLAGDYQKAVEESSARISKRRRASTEPMANVSATYEDASLRSDVESPEFITTSEKFPSRGMQIHNEYTMYAHFYYLRQLLGTTEKVRFYMDQESGIRAACLAAFEAEIKARRCDAFFVSVAKDLTIDTKRKIIAESRIAFEAMQRARPELTEREVQVLMMAQEMKRAAPFGKWSDKWLCHPFPNSSEPQKVISYLTDFGDYEESHLAHLYLKGSLHGIDRFFMQVRRKLSLLERPIGTPSRMGRTWYGYSPYQPENIEKVLEIFRVYYNFCLAGKDGDTPAMRLGLVSHVVEIDELIRFT